MVSKFHNCFIQLYFGVRFCNQAVEIKKTSKIGQKLPFFGQFLGFFKVISILTAWSQLLTLHLNSTNFWGYFETTYSSGSVLIRNLIFSIEFVICGKTLDEKSLCVYIHQAFFMKIFVSCTADAPLGCKRCLKIRILCKSHHNLGSFF